VSAADYGSFETLAIEELADGVLLLRLDRPERLNALSWTMVDEIHAATTAIGKDLGVRVVVLTGAGRGFCAGLDIKADDALSTDESVVTAFGRQEAIAGLTLALRNLPQPVIAAVNGPAAGGGLALALAADVRVATPEARFNVAFVRIGISGCDIGVSHMLPRIVGEGIAAEMMLTGRLVEPEEALRTGLVNRVVDADKLLDEVRSLAAEIARNSPFGVRMTKQVLHRNVDAPSIEAAIELENRTQVLSIQTEDVSEALGAFQEKREPQFRNR
jgi:enoyl-CoA hydratase